VYVLRIFTVNFCNLVDTVDQVNNCVMNERTLEIILGCLWQNNVQLINKSMSRYKFKLFGPFCQDALCINSIMTVCLSSYELCVQILEEMYMSNINISRSLLYCYVQCLYISAWSRKQFLCGSPAMFVSDV